MAASGKFASGRIGAITISSNSAGPLTRSPASGRTLKVHVFNNGAGTQHVGTITGVVANNAGCFQAGWFRIAPIAAPGPLGPGQTVDLGSR